MKWSSTVRKWSRLIHRDLSFFFSGMVLIYAISGIVMNHRDTINPNFSITRKEYKIAEKLPDKAGMSKEKVLTLLEPLGETGNYTKFYFPKTDVMKVFLKGGSNLLVNVKTGDAVYESVTRRPLIGAMSRLHYNPGQWWTYFADIFRYRPYYHYSLRHYHAEREQGHYRQRRNRTNSRNLDSHSFPFLLLNRNNR